jgi:FtsP/CotA-like multicopper oxidase with cupredoxin domain
MVTRVRFQRALVFSCAAALALSAQLAPRLGAQAAQPLASANDNRKPAGQLRNGTLTLRLEVRTSRWQPEEGAGPTRVVQAFAEEGQAPQIPGPLVRVPEGTEIQTTVTNRLGVALRLHGMMTRPADSGAAVEIAPGASQEFKFKSGRAGTYFYWAETTGVVYTQRLMVDSQLTGAFIVDPARVEDRLDDRIFVLSEWAEIKGDKFSATINGRSWPHTERLTLPYGQPAEWRVINGAFGAHPMHLHGTFYTVESKGDAGRDTIYGADGRRLVTTELMEPGTTMTMRWVPDRVGNWLFHCHILAHVSGQMREGDMTPDELAHASHAEHDIEHAMAGLVLGIKVPAGDETGAPDLERFTPMQHTIEMIQKPHQYGDEDGFGFRFVDPRPPTDPGPPIAPDELATSPTLVLTRGQPVVIDLINRLQKPTQIHWHGIELESYNDGVPGWSGTDRQVTPLIDAGTTYRVHFTPPRAGTFIFHTHAHDSVQLGNGLYGALIVVEPGKALDPETNRIVLLGGGGPAIEMNRSTNPTAMDLKVGVKYRFRLIDISTNFTVTVCLRGDSGPAQWRAVAKDGADLPPSQATKRPASQVISVGETYDFEFEPTTPGELRLEVLRRGASGRITTQLVRIGR